MKLSYSKFLVYVPKEEGLSFILDPKMYYIGFVLWLFASLFFSLNTIFKMEFKKCKVEKGDEKNEEILHSHGKITTLLGSYGYIMDPSVLVFNVIDSNCIIKLKIH